ncbi:hypothetical protein RXV86_09275 [Alisedimentitalea sp. MJ-SS2]|uniref:hypothetical protein n=1 Tax=Aliisedimentitalea sp. MJ-SS2 TaxID=3049795 RepID=UPI0029085B2E|nr:hypothetical protein [Alisedimentitalea sp. MJ-SS2]MDU8927574.1 hypothetical protein [Alisedimentitalea sp. MJ-SS2]
MKIRKNTDHTLIVENRPWFFAIMISVFILVFTGIGIGLLSSGELMGLVPLAVGLVMAPLFLYIFARRVQVVFYRPEGWVEIRRANLRGTSKIRYDIEEIQRAILESTQSDSSTLYRVTLMVEKGGVAGPVPLTQAYSNIGKHRQVTDAINAWLSA